MTRLLEFLASTLEPAYGFSSLFRFKAKFNPDYETISMAYPDPLALPTIGARDRQGVPARGVAEGGSGARADAHEVAGGCHRAEVQAT